MSIVAFRANSLFHPDNVTTESGQPMGFDQWNALYGQYVVTGSKITAYISYDRQDVSVNPPMCVGIYLADDATIPYTNWQGMVEARKGTYRTLTPMQAYPVKVQSRFSCRKFFNIKDPLDNIDHVGAAHDADPSDLAIFVIWAQVSGSYLADQKVELGVNIVIDFIAQWSEPEDIPRS